MYVFHCILAKIHLNAPEIKRAVFGPISTLFSIQLVFQVLSEVALQLLVIAIFTKKLFNKSLTLLIGSTLMLIARFNRV